MTDVSISTTAHLASGAKELLSHARNVNSQIGEDGIVEHILSLMPERDKWCVEFGAWDGKYLSNTRRLIDEDGYNAVLIEANPKTFRELKANMASNTGVHCVEAFVGYDAHDNLDHILSQTDCPKNFDFLSIDIDGNDIHVWSAVREFRPKLVCIEYNPTIPTVVSFAQPRDPGTKWGASLRALFEQGQKMGYRLVCANDWNGFFVAEEYWTGEYCRTAEELPQYRRVEEKPVYLFSGYDGTVLTSSDVVVHWHGFGVGSSRIQVLPSYLRRFPDDYSWLQRALFKRVKRYLRSPRLGNRQF